MLCCAQDWRKRGGWDCYGLRPGNDRVICSRESQYQTSLASSENNSAGQGIIVDRAHFSQPRGLRQRPPQ